MKVAITFSYLGDEYHGSQIQPSLKTVQGELQKACKRLNWSPKGVKISSRTDAGVNARMNFALGKNLSISPTCTIFKGILSIVIFFSFSFLEVSIWLK